jgi:hypothetical protein
VSAVNGSKFVDQMVLGTAAGRIAVGALTLAAPAVLARSFGVDKGSAERTAFLARMFAAREIGLGLGTLYAVRRSGSTAARRSWLLAGVLADVGDTWAFALVTRGGDGGRIRGGAMVAIAAGAAGGGIAALLGGGPPTD